LSHKGEPLKSWSFIGAYPVKIQTSELNAKNNSLVIETVELAYKYSRPVSLNDINEKPADPKIVDKN
jgi:phage tail-like protein